MSDASAQADSDTDENRLLENQVSELYRNSNLANLAIFAVAIFLAWILWPVADPYVLMAWCAYTLIITGVRIVITQRYRTAESRTANLKLWLDLHTLGVFLAGLGWGSVIVFVIPVDARFHLISAIFIIAGLVTASAGSLASLKHGFAIFSIPALLPGAMHLIMINETDTVLMGLFICAFLIFISMVALRIHKVILYSLRTQFESAKHVVVVQEENAALVDKFNDLVHQLELSSLTIVNLQAALAQSTADYASATEAAERKSRGDRFNLLLDKLHGGAWDYNLNTGEIRFSSQWLGMLGYKEDEVYPSMDFWKSLLHPDECTEVLANLHAHISGRIPEYFSSHRLKARSGEWVWVFSRGQAVVWGKFGEVLNMVCVEIDIEDPQTHLAGKLTAANFKARDWLYSETMFTQRLEYALRTTAVANVTHALCHISVYSLDLPANVNLLPGNELSSQLASILVRECRQADPVLDIGNSSFVVLLENLAVDKAINKAAALQKIINAHQFGTGGQRFHVNTYIGITPILDAHKTIPEIFEDAATACSIAASDTPDNIFVYQRGNVEFDAGVFEKRVFTKIREILADKLLQLTAASLSPLAESSGSPARLFWLTATLPGLKNYAFAADSVDESAETNSLATAFDLCAIEMFQDWARAQPRSYTEQQYVYIYACKLSSILDADFAEQIAQIYAQMLPLKYFLCLAIPEAVFIAHNAKMLQLITTLKALGIRTALSDFGASSFSYDYLKHLPVDYLQLHDTLVANIDTDQTSVLTVKYFNETGHVLNFRSIAFCNSAAQEAALATVGTHYIRPAVAAIHRLSLDTATVNPASSTPHLSGAKTDAECFPRSG